MSDLLAARREAIRLVWRGAARAEPEQTTGRALTLGQFLDHIPEILDAFESKLRFRPGGTADRAADRGKKVEEVKHGLHRWQQGYRLRELMGECVQLRRCLFEELRKIAAAHPELDHATFVEAFRQLLHLINDTISESAVQYERMQQAEAAGGGRRPHERAVMGLNAMLGELMDLARLEAGQENREIAEFDVGVLIAELCDSHQPYARERGLFLRPEAPDPLCVEGDAEKVRRVAKNLLGNALKYTHNGGVTVTWGEEKKNCWLMVKDTGPGMKTDFGASMVAGLHEATASAKESDEKSSAIDGKSSQVLPSLEESCSPTGLARHQPGEGIGLSIVNRLRELLDASLEIASSEEVGTTFRVVFPRRYDRLV